MERREIDLKEALKNKEMLPKPLFPVAAGGVREERQHLRRLQEKLLSGAIHISVLARS